MNILYYSYKLCYPPTEGTSMRTYNLIKELSRYHNVYLVCISEKDAAEESISHLKEFCKEVVIIPSFHKRSLVKYFKSLFSSTPYKILQFQSKESDDIIKKMVEKYNIDVLLLNYVFIASKAILDMKVKKCLISPNLEFILLKRYIKIGNLVRKIYGLSQWKKLMKYELESHRHFDMTIFISEEEAEKARSYNPEINTEIIEGGINTEYLTSRRKGLPERPNIVFVGSMWFYPNVHAAEILIKKILPLVEKEVPDITVTIVGAYPVKAVKKFANIENVFVTGFVKDVRVYIDSGTVYAVPVYIGSGIRYKILEALSMSIPVVSTTLGCENLGVSHGKNILIADTPEEIAKNLIKLIKDKELWNKISSEGRKLLMNRYNVKIAVKELNEVFKKILGD